MRTAQPKSPAGSCRATSWRACSSIPASRPRPSQAPSGRPPPSGSPAVLLTPRPRELLGGPCSLPRSLSSPDHGRRPVTRRRFFTRISRCSEELLEPEAEPAVESCRSEPRRSAVAPAVDQWLECARFRERPAASPGKGLVDLGGGINILCSASLSSSSSPSSSCMAPCSRPPCRPQWADDWFIASRPREKSASVPPPTLMIRSGSMPLGPTKLETFCKKRWHCTLDRPISSNSSYRTERMRSAESAPSLQQIAGSNSSMPNSTSN
mmetsp:Transcript_75549/g.245657  ORF Transcript_75549/g.245657 Transcript_75549/m.245657 type:complete len:266 (-) Transcript_75549:113-910(-)